MTISRRGDPRPPRASPPGRGLRNAPAACAAAAALLLGACGGGIELDSAGSGGGPGGPGSPGDPLAIPLQFAVKNEATTGRTETICASVPFPESGYPNLANVVVSGHRTAWRVLQRWRDGTVRIGQAQFTDTIPAGTSVDYAVARNVAAETGPFARNNWVEQMADGLAIGAMVRDTFGVEYRAFVAGGGETLQETPLVQVKRFRTYHQPTGGAGIGRDYLTSTFYVAEYRDVPVVVVDWVLGNDYLGIDVIPAGNTDPNLRPLGAIDVREARFLCRGSTTATPYRPVEEAIAAAEVLSGFTTFRVMQDDYIDDGQTRRYRFVLGFEHPAATTDERLLWRTTALAMAQKPLFPLAKRATWQQTAGAGLLGGPIDGPADSYARCESDYQSWANSNHFGTWGSRGDPKNTGQTGTPRNHPLSPELAHAIQGQHPRLLVKLEQMAWAQAMRPYHLYGLAVGDLQDILLWDGIPIHSNSRDLSTESLGRRAIRNANLYSSYRTMVQFGPPRAHDWGHFDHEHWTTDLLFDYWTISGDAWAQEELRQMGQSLKALMRLVRYTTAWIQATRAEGWTMQGFTQSYLATGDENLRDYAMRRVRQTVDAQRQKTHASRAMCFQGDYVGTTFPLPHRFYMPWQEGAVLWGYLGAYKFWGDPLLLTIAEDSATAVEYGWVVNYQDPVRGLVLQGLRYYVPVAYQNLPVAANVWDFTTGIGVRWGDAPLGGAHTFLTGGLHHLALMTGNTAVRARALQYGSHLKGTIGNPARWDKWTYCLPLQYVP